MPDISDADAIRAALADTLTPDTAPPTVDGEIDTTSEPPLGLPGTGLDDLGLDPTDPIVQQLLANFEARDEQSRGGPTVTTPAAPPEDAAPAVEDAPTDAPPAPATGEAAPEPVSAPTASNQATNDGDGWVDVGGQRIPLDYVTAAIATQNYLASLSPDQLAALDAAINPTSTPAAAPAPRAADTGDDGDDEYIDPRAARDIAALRDQLAAVTASQQADQARIYQAREREVLVALEAASSDVATRFNLSAADVDRLQGIATQLQRSPALIAKHNNAYQPALTEALEEAMWVTPEYRDRLIQSRIDAAVQTQLNAQSAEISATAERKAKAGALAGSPSGSISRAPVSADPRQMNRIDLEAAMAKFIREQTAVSP